MFVLSPIGVYAMFQSSPIVCLSCSYTRQLEVGYTLCLDLAIGGCTLYQCSLIWVYSYISLAHRGGGVNCEHIFSHEG